MKRRLFITLLGGVATGWPLAARSQQAMHPVIGMLGSASLDQWSVRLRAFREGLSETGHVEGKALAIEYRWAEGDPDRLPGLASDLVRRRVNVIVVLGNTASVLAAKAASTTIPIVFRVAANPVATGLVASLARPGGNLTGVTTLGVEVGPKQLQLLQEMVPSARKFAVLINPTNSILADIQSRTLSAAAATLGQQLQIVKAGVDRDFDMVFATLRQLQIGGLIISADAFFNSRNQKLAALAVAHAMPTISPYREFAESGGLMSYGGSIAEASRLAGVYTGRILNGEAPADLPVQQVAKFEFVVNLKTAKALGIETTHLTIARADEVIE